MYAQQKTPLYVREDVRFRRLQPVKHMFPPAHHQPAKTRKEKRRRASFFFLAHTGQNAQRFLQLHDEGKKRNLALPETRVLLRALPAAQNNNNSEFRPERWARVTAQQLKSTTTVVIIVPCGV